MGLFNQTQTTVGTSVSRVIEDAALPNSNRNGTIKSIFADDDQLIENVMEEMVAGIGVRAMRMYDYGKSGYVYGLPSSVVVSSGDAHVQVQTQIELEQGGPVTMDYYRYGAANDMHIGWVTLCNNFGYDSSTNQIGLLSTAQGHPVYLVDMQIVLTTATAAIIGPNSMEQWGTPPNAGYTPITPLLGTAGTLKPVTVYKIDAAATLDYIDVSYCYEQPDIKIIGTTVDPVTKVETNIYSQNKIVVQNHFRIFFSAYDLKADYHQAKFTRNGKSGYWMYKNGAGTYPAIDKVYDHAHSDLGSYFPFVYARFAKEAGNKYPQSDEFKSSKKLTNYLNMDYASMCDGINSSPDITDVEQAMIIMAVPADTTNSYEQRYLFDYFDRMFLASAQRVIPENIDLDKRFDLSPTQTSIMIQDKRFKMAIVYDGITKRSVTGSIGKIGSHKSSYTTVGTVGKATSHIYQRQITEVTYEEISVVNLKTMYYIFGNYTSIGDDNDEILLIPLDHAITLDYSTPHRETLFARSLHYVFNSRITTKLKWYETSIFRTIMIIIAIVVTILSWGEAWESISAAVALGTVTVEMVLMAILIGVIKFLVVGYLVKLFVQAFGVKVAFLAAIVAAVYGSYGAGTNSVAGAPFASEMMQASSALVKGIQVDIQADFDLLKNEASDFEKYVAEQTKVLDTANDLLNGDNIMNPMIVFGEKPKDYYDRTVHSGNIGVLGVDAISSYVDISLMLPTLTDTVGDTFYG